MSVTVTIVNDRPIVNVSSDQLAVQRAIEARNEAQGFAQSASDDADQTALDRIATGEDRTQTGLDADATAADRVQTGLDVIATGEDVIATAADRVQTGLDADATAADRVQTGIDVQATNADAIVTNADRIQTGLDAQATGSDRVQTGLDRVATGEDRVQTGLDAQATASDRVQTGLDVQATNADADQTALDRIATGEDRTQTGLDVIQTGADRVQTGLDVIATEAARDEIIDKIDFTDQEEDDIYLVDETGVGKPVNKLIFLQDAINILIDQDPQAIQGPQGIQGEKGDTGDQGIQGDSFLTEETDHIQTPKPIREAPFNPEDQYIKDSETALTNINQFGITGNGEEIILTSIYLPLLGSTISFNVNNILGSRSQPIATDDFSFTFSDAIQENKCIVYSQRATKPAILDNAVVLEKGDSYDTAGGVNRIVFEYIDDELVIATVTNLAASVIETAPLFIGTGTQTGYNNTTFEHTIDFSTAVDGDLMICSFSRAAGSDNPLLPPSGWDELADVSNMMTIFARKRTTGDPDVWVFTNEFTSQSRGVVMPILRDVNYTNGDTSTLTIGSPLAVGSAAPSRDITSITATGLGLVLAFAVAGSGTAPVEITWESGWTVRQTRVEFFNTQRLSSVSSKEVNGVTGDVTFTLNQTLNTSGVLIAFYKV